jgi:hypothetical protein
VVSAAEALPPGRWSALRRRVVGSPSGAAVHSLAGTALCSLAGTAVLYFCRGAAEQLCCLVKRFAGHEADSRARQDALSRAIALRIVSSFRAHAISATFFTFPAASNR